MIPMWVGLSSLWSGLKYHIIKNVIFTSEPDCLGEKNFLEGRKYTFQKKGQLCKIRKSDTLPLHYFSLNSDPSFLPIF